MKKRLCMKALSGLLVLIMLLGMLPVSILAAEKSTTVVKLDFSADASKGKAVTAFTEAEDGWAYATGNSAGVTPLFYKHAQWDYSCLRLTQNSVGGMGAISFNAPVSGTYKMDLTYCVGNNGNYVDVSVGGTTTSYFAWANWGTAPKSISTEGVKLTAGSNLLTITTPEKVTGVSLLMLKDVTFTLVEEASEEDSSVVTLDFAASAQKGKAVSAFAESVDGWAYDASNSSNVTPLFYQHAKWDSSALRFTQSTADGVGAISFTAPESGSYRMDLTYCVGNNCSDTVVEVGGTTTSFFAWANWGTEDKTVTTHNVQLQKGSNVLTITNTSAAAQMMLLRKIVFTRTGDCAPIPKTKLDVSQMSWSVPTADAAVYDGKQKEAVLNGTLPEGVEVTLTGNKATEIGTYTATATFTLADGYSEDKYEIIGTNPLTREWKITSEPASGLVIDLQSVGNTDADHSLYGVTGNGVTEYGWGLNTDETVPGKNPGTTFKWHFNKANLWSTPALEDGSWAGVYLYSTPTGIGFTFNFYVPENGYYRPDLTAVSNTRCGGAAAWVDGAYIGEYYGYGTDEPVLTTYNMNTVYLTKGVHKILLRPTTVSEKYANYYWIYLNRIEFAKQEAAQEVADITFATKKENIYLNDNVGYTVIALDQNGQSIYLGEDRDGSVNWSVTSSDPTTVKLEDGRLYALKEGCADITVTVTLPESEKTITKTITVQGEPEAADFEICFDQDARGDKKVSDFNLDDDGFKFIQTSGTWLSSWADEITMHGKYMGLVTKQLVTYGPSNYLTIDIKAPATGDYRLDIHHVLRTVCGETNVYFDGEYIGTYNGNGTNWVLDQDSLTTVHMERNQVYRLTFVGQIPTGGDSVYMFLHKLCFVVSDEEPVPVDRVVMSVGRASMAVGEDCVYAFTALDADRNRLPIDQPLIGYESKYFVAQIEDPSVISLEDNVLTAVAPGTTQLTLTVTYGGQTRTVTKMVEVNNDVLTEVSFYLPLDQLEVGESVQTGYNAKTNTGRELKHEHLETTYASSNEAVATIDENGLVTAVSQGEAELTITVTMAGHSAEATIPVTVSPKKGKISVSNPDGVMSMRPDDEDGIELLITGIDANGNELDLTYADITYDIATDGVIEIKDGRALPVALGNTTVYVTVTMPDGIVYETTTWISVNQGKVQPTYYTWEKRKAAQYNAINYSWANEQANAAVEKADWVVENLDAFYDMVLFEGIPRADGLGMREDVLGDNCPMCGVDTLGIYGHYSWITDPLNEPFKIKCPACKSVFPTNDFASFYECGLDQKGQFSVERAMENGGEKYLVNELYPEKGPDWGVDNGWGWDTGETYTNNAGSQEKRIYAFIGYYHANGLWNGFYSNASNNFRVMLNALRDAYLYTGNEEYGRTGAILIDRVADVYPTMSLTDAVYGKPRNNISALTPATLDTNYYSNNEGTYAQGKILGCISEGNFIAKDLCKAYDAFYPAFDDPEVVAYLAARAEEQGLVVNGENPKDTPQELRQNGIDGILHEVSEGVRNRDIWGNFGLPQASMALAAVVLDSTEYLSEPVDEPANMPTGDRRKMNSNEMIAWLYEKGAHAQNYMFNKIVSAISRDGHGDEVSPNYHYSWYQNLIDYADAMQGYEGYPGADLYENPKFIKMLVGNLYLTAGGNTTLQNGDSGGAGGIRIYLHADTLARAFVATGNVELAQALYYINGETTEGLVGSIFDPEADSLGSKVQEVIDEYGPYDVNSSVLLAGYGQALLKYGNKDDANQGLYSLWFGRIAGGHGNRNALDINIFAYGLNMAPSLGYPREANSDLVRSQWERGTISRNTVIIDDQSQTNYTYLTQYTNSDPYHFEDAGRVKVMDAEAVDAYEGLADEYRRTIVAIQGCDDAYYAVDFFNVIGGSTHLYSFHAAALEYPESDGVQTIPQDGGTYAGENVEFAANVENGYSYLYDVETDNDPANNFYLDYAIYDHKHVLENDGGLHLRLNMLSTEEEPFTEVTYAKGKPPVKEENPDYYPYALIRKDSDNSLFTAVYEPYRYNRYLDSMELVSVEVIDGTFYADDRAAAVKVQRTDGKVEYIVYCTNYDAVLRVDDRFDFSGFVGVVTYESAEPNANICYRYGMDATIVAGPLQEHKAITGKVVDFTRELNYENFITVTVDQQIDPEALVGRVIYVENDGEENGAYIIEGVTENGSNLTLDLGDQHLVRSLKEPANVLGGYYINIAVGQSYRIPMSASDDITTVVNYVPDHVIKAGGKLNVTPGVSGSGMTYEADGLVSGMRLDAKSGQLTWTTSKTNTGRFPVTVRAVDADGTEVASTSFVVYVVGYTGSTYSPDICSHSKAETFEANGMIETVCPSCGTITKEEKQAEQINIAGANMSLGNELKLNVMVRSADLGDGIYTAKITHGDTVTEEQFTELNSTYHYVSTTVSAKQMADVITVEVVDENGNAISDPYETSVRDYAMKALASTTTKAEMKTLAVDMLNYGAEAQTYFKYNAEDLANSLLTEDQKALATGTVPCENRQLKGTNFYGTNLSLEDRIILNLFFRNCTSDMYAEVSFTDYKGREKTVTKSLLQHSDILYRVAVDEIVLSDAFSDVTVTVYTADGTVHGTATDAVESYCARAGENALNTAIMKFAYSAKQYLN